MFDHKQYDKVSSYKINQTGQFYNKRDI